MPDSTARTYRTRSLESVLQKAITEFPAVVLLGPRQSGKTTLLKHLFEGRYAIVSLEPPDVRMAAENDPRGFLSLYPPPLILDEIQYAPNLLPYIKEQIDAHREQTGRYLLTGSQNLLLMEQVTESLAGRAAVLSLLPFSHRELHEQPHRPLPWEGESVPIPAISLRELWGQMLRGFYPEIACHPQRDPRLWQASYLQTYLERDVRMLRNIGDLTRFQIFLRALAARCAQVLNISDVARDVGVSVNTARDWISILEASFQIFLLRPYYRNIGKRLVKSPKVYFTDTGLLCYLVGLRDVEHAMAGPMGGAIFENLVVAEVFKTHLHRGEEARLYFWRTASGWEVDLLVETQEELIPIEIKHTETIRPEQARSLLQFQKEFADRTQRGYIIHPGSTVLPLGQGILSLPFAAL